jgi:hypothetical protein
MKEEAGDSKQETEGGEIDLGLLSSTSLGEDLFPK